MKQAKQQTGLLFSY